VNARFDRRVALVWDYAGEIVEWLNLAWLADYATPGGIFN
jgi:hypothetical protein